MKRASFVILIVACLFSLPSRADSWMDPTWRAMIDSADVIALVQYTRNGEFSADARVMRVYKSSPKTGDLIRVSGFSNRYGPIDRVRAGEQFIVFLSYDEPSAERLKYLAEGIEGRPGMKAYIRALQAGRSYYVTTPTSGDLRVQGNQVQYDLRQTTFYRGQGYFDLNEFQTFLVQAAGRKANESFTARLLDKVRADSHSDGAAQALLMLRLLDYSGFDPVFKKLATTPNPAVKFALAGVLGNSRAPEANPLLVSLLTDSSSLVQGEVARQLATRQPALAGPALLAHLHRAGEAGRYPSGIMDPVRNHQDGGKYEIINVLGQLRYQPAVAALLPLLDTDNKYLFNVTLRALTRIGTTDYIPYLDKRLRAGDREFVETICRTITDHGLEACIPALMHYVATHDKTVHPSQAFTISPYWGLAHFNTDTVKTFLHEDFKRVLQMAEDDRFNPKQRWMEAYLEAFTHLRVEKAKPDLYAYLYDTYGIGAPFKNNPLLFEHKKRHEDSLVRVVQTVLAAERLERVKAIAFLQVNADGSPRLADYLIRVEAPPSALRARGTEAYLDRLVAELTEAGFPKDRLVASSGSYARSFAARPVHGFGSYRLRNFLAYLATVPDREDIRFLEHLATYYLPRKDFTADELAKFIAEAKENLKP
jgi:hypothetical protein